MNKIKNIAAIIFSIIIFAVILSGCGSMQSSSGGSGEEISVSQAANPSTQLSEDKDTESNDDDVYDEYTKPSGQSFGEFITEDLEGNGVTQEIFAEKDYTMINIWGTFCPPCIAEMPELQELYEALPDNIGFIGIVCDLGYGVEDEAVKADADSIVEKTGVKYKSLLIWDNAYKLLADISSAVPTTIFVDSDGNVVGDPIIGANIRAYESRIAHLSEAGFTK